MYIIITGNPVMGFTFHGPFDDSNEAMDYADQVGDEWWVTQLTAPEAE
jgi:hypothetical protein